MTLKPLALACALLLAAATAEAAPAAKKPGAKAPAKPAAPAAAPAQAAGALDTRDPATLVAIFTAGGGKAAVGRKEGDSVLVTVTSTAANFSVQFAGCDAQGRGCKAALFDSLATGAPTLAQINDYNQTSISCRGYQDRSGKAHVTMPWLLFADEPKAHAATTLDAWLGCVADFATFAQDPVRFLTSAS